MGNIIHPCSGPSKQVNLKQIKPYVCNRRDDCLSSEWKDETIPEEAPKKHRWSDNGRRVCKGWPLEVEDKGCVRTLDALQEISNPKSPHEKVIEWLAKNEQAINDSKTRRPRREEESDDSVDWGVREKPPGKRGVPKHTHTVHHHKYVKSRAQISHNKNSNYVAFKLKCLDSEDKTMLRTQKPLLEINDVLAPHIQNTFTTEEKRKGSTRTKKIVKQKVSDMNRQKEMPWAVQSQLLASHVRILKSKTQEASANRTADKSVEAISEQESDKAEEEFEQEPPITTELPQYAHRVEVAKSSSKRVEPIRNLVLKPNVNVKNVEKGMPSQCHNTRNPLAQKRRSYRQSRIPPFTLFQSTSENSIASIMEQWALGFTNSASNKGVFKKESNESTDV